MLHRVQLCLLLLWIPLAIAARDKAADVFLLSSHTDASEWDQRMMQPINALAAERPDLDISIAHLPFLSYKSEEALIHDRDSVLAAHNIPPRLVVLLGGSCFSFTEDIQKLWPGIPMLLIGEQDYYCDLVYTLFGPGDPNANRYPIEDLKDKGANISLISAPALLRQTIEMIIDVQPGLQNLFFVAGENYLSKERQWRIEEYIRDRHPEITCHVISSSDTSTDKLLSTLENAKGPYTAVFYASWMIREGYRENVSTRHNTVSLLEHITPLYTMFGSDFEKHPYVVGYCSYSQEEYRRTVRQRILDVLDNDVQPSEMPFAYLQTGIPTLNYKAMEHFGLDTGLIPHGADVIGAPQSLWLQYKKQIMWAAFFLLIGIGGYTFFTMERSLRSLRKARNMAENASNIKTAFIQNMSHEFRTPLNSIVGFSQLLCMPDGYVSDEEKAEYLSYIHNNSQLLTVMVKDMLDISDMENGQYSVNKAPTNLNEMARQAIKSAEFRVPPGVTIVRQPGLDEDARYLTDGMRVQQILINFLTNACKYSSKGEIVIGSSLVENPGYITFYVQDNGPGVPQEKAELIFERFVKLDNNKQGAGLGLSICRMMAANLGGRIWLDSNYTNGARFVLTIPKEEV
ncbi:MAG: HAMP domain-containing histidine kinase [Bacteroidales bacterium]|nr:HAMP domain-containing histidine kinase [Bacteroidales bacterium]